MFNFINRIKNIKNIEYKILFVILLLGFFVRLYKIDNPIADWHSFRQADTASVSRMYVENGINPLYPKYHDVSTTQSGLSNVEGYRYVEFPLYNVIHAYLYTTFKYFSLEVWGRLLSIIFSIISVIFIFLIGRECRGKTVGLISSFLFALIPFNIYFSRVILPEPLAVVLSLSGVWFFIKSINENNNLYLLISSIFLAISLLVKPYMIFYCVVIALLTLQKMGLKKLFIEKKYWLSVLIILLPLLLWRIWISQYPEGIPFWKWVFNDDGIRFKPAFWKWIFGERLSKLILGYWGIIPFVFGILKFKKRDIAIWGLLIGMFFYVSVIATANVRHDYYQTLIIPAVTLTTGLGIKNMWTEKNNKLKMRIITIFSVSMIIVASFSEIKEFYKINRPEIIEAGNAVSEVTNKDALVIAPYYGDTAFLYQTKRRGWPVVDRPLNELIDKGAEYFVSVDLNHYQTVEFEKKYKTIIKTDKYIILDLNKPNL